MKDLSNMILDYYRNVDGLKSILVLKHSLYNGDQVLLLM